jgi:hypothetical protein
MGVSKSAFADRKNRWTAKRTYSDSDRPALNPGLKIGPLAYRCVGSYKIGMASDSCNEAIDNSSSPYGPEYYASHCGPVPYARNDHWLHFFGNVADALIRSFAPRRVFDAGCAIGLLVEAMWDRGVEAHGRDISTWAISQVRPDIRCWCEVGTIADLDRGEYDLIACIEVLEHMPEAEAVCAIRAMANLAPRVLFSSSPTDFVEPTHINVRPTAYWLSQWADAGFAPSVTHDAGYLAPHAFILERSEEGRSARELLSFADRIRHRVALSQIGAAMNAVQVRLAELEREKDAFSSALAAAEAIAAEREARQRGRAEVAELSEARQRSQAEAARRRAEAAEALLVAQAAENSRRAEAAEESLVAQAIESRHEKAVALHERSEALALADLAQQEAATAHAELLMLRNSTIWRVTAPLRRCSSFLPSTLRRRVRQALKLIWWTMSFQVATRLRARQSLNSCSVDPLPSLEDVVPDPPSTMHEVPPPTVEDLFTQRFANLSALPVFATPSAGARRLSIVTDSINTGSLYGGVGTALILGALAARRIGATLRLITRTEAPDSANVRMVLTAHGIPWDGSLEVIHTPVGPTTGRDVPTSDSDFFLTTSWWTTWSTRQSVRPERIAYLLQEDERMFYPLGDDYLRCSETLRDPSLLYLVNTEQLLGHLCGEGLAPGATAFEPSFPSRIYRPHPSDVHKKQGKRNLFFYARPDNVRNLYWRGLEVLSLAITEGIFDPDDWDFYFAGHGAGPLRLPGGAQAIFPGPMAWPEYAALAGRMDVGLCLMYTPHPSYPPLDLAASGSVVVTNRFGRKRDLDRYSSNIICVDPDVPSLVQALRDAASLSADKDARTTNFARSGLQRDWEKSMLPALDRIAAWAQA